MDPFKIPSQAMLQALYEKYRSTRLLITGELERTIEKSLEMLPSHPTVKGRVKEFESYYKKYIRLLKDEPGNSKSPRITDLIGIRIVCPFSDDLPLVEDILKRSFSVTDVERKSVGSFKEFGYESTHLLIKIPETIIKKQGDCGLEEAEIQIRTILQDAWAEVEHELVYKAEFTPFGKPMKRKLAAVNASLSLADAIFQDIRAYQRQLTAELGKRRDSFFKKVEESTDVLLFTSESACTPLLGRDISSEAVDTDNASVVDMDASIDDLLLKALSAHNNNQFKEAIALYTRILDMSSDNNVIGSLIYKHRGMANFAQSRYGDAIDDFTQSLKLDQSSHNAAYYRGIVNAVLQRFFDAIDDFTLSLTIHPYQPFCLYRRGQAYYHVEDLPQALSDCEAALQLKPDFEQVNRFKDILLFKMKM